MGPYPACDLMQECAHIFKCILGVVGGCRRESLKPGDPLNAWHPTGLFTWTQTINLEQQGGPPPSNAPEDTWHSPLSPQQTQKLLGSWTAPGFTPSQRPSPRQETLELVWTRSLSQE